jgi:hypothetical protein
MITRNRLAFMNERKAARIAELEAALREEKAYARALERLNFSRVQDPVLLANVRRAATKRKERKGPWVG